MKTILRLRPATPTLNSQPRLWISLVKRLAERPTKSFDPPAHKRLTPNAK